MGGRDWVILSGNGVQRLISELDGGNGEGRAESPRLELVGESGEIRILTSLEDIIRRIGPFQSPIRSPVGEVVGVAVVVGDELFEVGESGVWEG